MCPRSKEVIPGLLRRLNRQQANIDELEHITLVQENLIEQMKKEKRGREGDVLLLLKQNESLKNKLRVLVIIAVLWIGLAVLSRFAGDGEDDDNGYLQLQG